MGIEHENAGHAECNKSDVIKIEFSCVERYCFAQGDLAGEPSTLRDVHGRVPLFYHRKMFLWQRNDRQGLCGEENDKCSAQRGTSWVWVISWLGQFLIK